MAHLRDRRRTANDAYARIISLVCDEDALGQHDVNTNVSVDELSNAYVPSDAQNTGNRCEVAFGANYLPSQEKREGTMTPSVNC